MNHSLRRSSPLNGLRATAALWLAGSLSGGAMTYYLVDNGSWWPADVRSRIVAAMDEAVATYNANGYFNVNVRVNYNTGIPTAQSNYNGELGFGGNAGYQTARVAIHEISHYLGTGTTNEWNAQFNGNVWVGAATRHFIKLFDGPGGELFQSGQHYYPYGLNYDNEDSYQNRIREVKLIQAMRFDMGGNDGDGDGMSDEWEIWKFGGTGQAANGDADGDGISNYDEWWTGAEPMQASPVKNGHTYIIRSRLSQKVMEVADNSQLNGGNVRQNAADGSAGQKWTAQYTGGGYWKFINYGSGKVLEVENVSTAAGANIRQWDWLNNDGQQWRIVPNGAIYSKVFNRASMNMVVDVEGGVNATGNGTNISQYYDVVGATNQDWAFDDVTPGEQPVTLQAEYKLDNTVRDNSGKGAHGVASGGITYTAGRVDGLAATFNGTSGSVAIPTTVETNFTLACWIQTTATAGTGQWYNGMGLIDAEVPGAAADFGLSLVGTKIGFGVGNADYTLLSSSAVNNGAWHHIAATRDNSTGVMKIYIDGVLSATGTGPAGTRNAPTKMRLGSIAGTGGFYNGTLDEVRLYNTILSQTEITRLATVGNTLVAKYAFEGGAQDDSNHGNHGDPMNLTYTAGKVGASAAQFDGTGSFVKIPSSVVGDFSVAYWVKTTASGGTGQWYSGKSMIDAELPGATDDWGISLVGSKAAFGVGNADKTIVSTSSINDGAWHHVVATRSNANGAMNLYVDGSLQASAATGPTAERTAPGNLRIGSAPYGGAYFAGAIDDVRIFNYTLNSAQAAALGSTLPAPLADMDVGSPGSDGYAGYSPATGVYTVVGGGIDTTSTSDKFNFLASTQSGDQVAITRVESIPVNTGGGTSGNAKAGIMFRDSSAANSAFVDLIYAHSAGLRFLYRNTTGGALGMVGSSVPISAPFWLKLARSGNNFEAYYSTASGTPSANDWISMGTRTTALVANPLVGMEVSSRNATLVATATFSNFQVSPPISAPGDVWRLAKFGNSDNTGNAADEADPDCDGISNLFERAFGLEPLVHNGPEAMPSIGRDESYLTLSYTRSLAATDINYQVVWSNTLDMWTAENVTDSVTSSDSVTETHQAKVPLTAVDPAHVFIRLRLEH